MFEIAYVCVSLLLLLCSCYIYTDLYIYFVCVLYVAERYVLNFAGGTRLADMNVVKCCRYVVVDVCCIRYSYMFDITRESIVLKLFNMHSRTKRVSCVIGIMPKPLPKREYYRTYMLMR